MTKWDELQPKFRDAVLHERKAGKTTTEIADAIPVGRTTVFRMMKGEVRRPPLATQDAVERMVKRYVESQVELPEGGSGT